MERQYNERVENIPSCCYRKFVFIQDFAVFDFLRGKYYKADGTWQQKVVLFFCGASAGICSLTATTPIEFVRVRLAMEIDNFTYKNNFGAFKDVHRK